MLDDIADLVLFAEIAEAGSLTAAGRALGLPKSTVSRRLQALEDRIGSRLLARTTRRLVPTDLGERLLARVNRIRPEFSADPAGTTPNAAFWNAAGIAPPAR